MAVRMGLGFGKWIEAAPVIAYPDFESVPRSSDGNGDTAGAGVLADVRQGLLDDVHDLQFLGRVERRAIAVTFEMGRNAGLALELSRKEFDLLWLLASRAGEVVTKREMLAEVWSLPFGGGDRTVDVHLSWLRRKLGETAAKPHYLHTIRGVGVRLAAPAED